MAVRSAPKFSVSTPGKMSQITADIMTNSTSLYTTNLVDLDAKEDIVHA